MPNSLGYATIAAWTREALVSQPTWPAASPAQARRRLPVLSVQQHDGVQVATSTTTLDRYGPGASDLTGLLPAETWTLQLRYEGFEELLACALGYMARSLDGTTLPQDLGGGAYRHLYEVDTLLSTAQPWTADDGVLGGTSYRVRRGTAAVDRQVSVWQTLSTMVNKLTLSATVGGVTLAVELVGYARDRASAVNTQAVLQALPFINAPNVLFRQGAVRLGASSTTTALDASNALDVSQWTLSLDNHLTAQPGPRTGLAPEECERSQAPSLTLGVTLPHYAADTFLTAYGAGTPLMAQIQLTAGRVIAGTNTPYQLTLWCPSLVLTQDDSPVNGPALPGETLQGQLLTPTARPAGFPASHHLGPLQIEVVSGEHRHPLLDD